MQTKKFVLFLLLATISLIANATESYYLTKIVQYYKPKLQEHPKVSLSKKMVDRLTIQLDGRDISLSNEKCSVHIDNQYPFSVPSSFGRTFQSQILDASGGEDKFRIFLKKKLNAEMEMWKSELLMGRAKDKSCSFLNYSLVYLAEQDIFVFDDSYIYKFSIKNK